MSQKYCPQCQTEKEFSEFGPNKSKKDGFQSQCKDCRREYMRTWYTNNTDLQKKRSKISKNKIRLECRVNIMLYLREHPCIDCGNPDIEVLEFDHRDPTAKEFAVSDFFNRGANWQRVLSEIEKCDVRCANCHRKKS